MSRLEAVFSKIDWRGWLTLAWAGWFGVLYVRMVLEARAPGLLDAISSSILPSWKA